MRSFFHDWWQALRLPWDNHIRQDYRKNNIRGLDPAIILTFNSFAMIFVVVCFVISINYNDNQGDFFGKSIIYMCGMMSPLLIILYLLLNQLFYGSYVEYLQGISRPMNMSIHELGYWPENRFTELVETRLIYLARTLQDMETEYPAYFPEVTRAKKNFQMAYDTFARAGLISDNGYKKYFQKTKTSL